MMQVTCDKCGKIYKVDENKIKGEKARLKCKSCENIIIVTKPKPGEWHSPWYAYKLEPTKEVVRKVLRYHRDDVEKKLKFITTEMINLPDYGHNARFSLIEQNAAIAQFVRETWNEINE